jgi:hypothetical protein
MPISAMHFAGAWSGWLAMPGIVVVAGPDVHISAELRGASGLGARKGSLSYTPYGLKGLQIRGSRSPGGLEGS